MFAQVYTKDGNIMVDFLQLGTRYPVLDLDLDPGDYHIRVEGQWQHNETAEYVERRYNTAGYVFGLSVPGTVELISECSSTLIGGDLSIVLSSLDDRLRTAIDSANGAGCKFNKPIARVLLVLDSDDSDHLHGDLPYRPAVAHRRFPAPGRRGIGEQRRAAAARRLLAPVPPSLRTERSGRPQPTSSWRP